MKLKKWNVTKLSEAHRIALLDLRKVERSKKYTVDMGTYCDIELIKGKRQCTVCLAGSVIARDLGGDQQLQDLIDDGDLQSIEPSQFDERTAGLLRAMDYLRTGDVYEAIVASKVKLPKGLTEEETDGMSRYIGEYYYDSGAWWKEQWKLNRDLVRAGL